MIKLVEHSLPRVADILPSRMRFYVLPLVPVLRLMILFIAMVLLLRSFINPTPQNLFAVLGSIGLAIGFALKDAVSSLVAGIVATFERPYRPGDWVEIDGAYGEVKSLETRALRMVTLDDTHVFVPHRKIWDSNVFNANNGRRELQCVADFYLNPNHDASNVRQKLHDVALTSPYLRVDSPITVIVAEKPWGTHYRLKAYPVEGRDQLLFTSD